VTDPLLMTIDPGNWLNCVKAQLWTIVSNYWTVIVDRPRHCDHWPDWPNWLLNPVTDWPNDPVTQFWPSPIDPGRWPNPMKSEPGPVMTIIDRGQTDRQPVIIGQLTMALLTPVTLTDPAQPRPMTDSGTDPGPDRPAQWRTDETRPSDEETGNCWPRLTTQCDEPVWQWQWPGQWPRPSQAQPSPDPKPSQWRTSDPGQSDEAQPSWPAKARRPSPVLNPVLLNDQPGQLTQPSGQPTHWLVILNPMTEDPDEGGPRPIDPVEWPIDQPRQTLLWWTVNDVDRPMTLLTIGPMTHCWTVDPDPDWAQPIDRPNDPINDGPSYCYCYCWYWLIVGGGGYCVDWLLLLLLTVDCIDQYYWLLFRPRQTQCGSTQAQAQPRPQRTQPSEPDGRAQPVGQ